ncbi:MAG: hypothetical protein GPJ50_15335, partial [Candidatus Heimdallarchaeota archaeon]|nr:hypothetical protein [Candidatus Heimdallarchaeota archaeon]
YVFDSRWIEIVRLGAADLGSAAKRGRYEATEFVKAILNVEDDFEEAKRPLILAGYILSDDVKLEPGVEKTIIDNLFNEYLNTDYVELMHSIWVVIEELLRSEKEKVISERIKELAISENVRAVDLLGLIEVEEALLILSNLAKSKSVGVKRVTASSIMKMYISQKNRANEKIIGIRKNLIEDEDFITFFYIAVSYLFNNIRLRFPDMLRKSHFRKYALFFLPSDPLIEFNELVKDKDHKIKEIAIQIKRHAETEITMSIYPHIMSMFSGRNILSILAPKPDSDLAYFEISMNTEIIEWIRAVKNSDLSEDSKLPATSSIIEHFGEKLTINDIEKIFNNFRNELDILYSIIRPLGDHAHKLSLHKFLKAEDPVISLFISDILNEKPDEKIIKECIEIFREDKNDRNKRPLFSMLYRFFDPFTRAISVSAKLEIKSE